MRAAAGRAAHAAVRRRPLATPLVASAAPPDPWGALPAALTPAHAASLVDRGYAIVDGALSADTCAAVRGELDTLRAAGLLRLNSTHLVPPGGGPRRLLEKRGIWEAEPGDAGFAEAAPTLAAAATGAPSLAALLAALEPRLDVTGGSVFKAQLNEGRQRDKREGEKQGAEAFQVWRGNGRPRPTPPSRPSPGGGACFPIHVDSDETLDARRVTAVAYAGSDDWQPADGSGGNDSSPPLSPPGGALRLYPTLAGPPLDIAPVPGRLALFSACRLPHRVMPAAARRWCFSIWLSARPRGSPTAPPPSVAAVVERLVAERGGTWGLGGGRGGERGGTRGSPVTPLNAPTPSDPPATAAAARAALLASPDGRRALYRLRLAGEWADSLREAHPPGPAADVALATHAADGEALAGLLARVGVDARAAGLGEGEGDPPAAWF